jgi:hypothetical protein
MKQSLQAEIRWPRRVVTPGDAVRFINAVGYCLLFPITRLPLPSLYYACARRDIHLGPGWDKYCEKIWRWKDELPRQQRAFYAKYFKLRGTFISLAMLPHFLAMRGTAAAASDHERFYSSGLISHDASTIWQTLDKLGPLARLELRHACKMESAAGNQRFKRAMAELQCLLVVVHFGAEQETESWASVRYELTARTFPKQVAAARRISPEAARAALAAKYQEWHPDAPPALLARLFGWTKGEAVSAARGARAVSS